MATEPADVLIIGAGASGAVVALRLAQAGFKVVCLEQGEWLNRADYPGNKLDWELKARKDWATSPNIRGLASDYPIVEDDTPVSPLMYNAVGGSTIIFAGAWPRALPSDFRVRSLDGIADDWPIDYFELLPYFYRTDRQFGVSGLPGDPAYPPDTEDAPMPPLPIGSAGLKVARGQTKLGWHWWPEFNSINSTDYDGRRPCVQRSTCQSGCNEGAKASTDLTHWPKAIALGARLVTGARVRRIETNERGPRDRRDVDRQRRRRAPRAGQGRRRRRQRDRDPAAAADLGRRRAPRRPRELVGARRQAADDASVRERRRPVRGAADELAGPVRRPHRVARVLRDRREARLRPRRTLGPRPDRRPDQHRAPEPRRRAGLGPGPSPARPVAPRPRRQLGPVRRGPPRREEPHHALVDRDRRVGDPGARDPLPDVRQLAPDARLPHRAGEGVDGRRRAPTRSRSTG